MSEPSADQQKQEPLDQEDRSQQNARDSEASSPENRTKEDLLKELQEIQKESKKNYDLYLRSQAEMENLKKRARKEKEDWLKYANENLIKEILPVMDNLEKALSHSENENNIHALKEGILLTLKGLKDSLSKSGLEEVKSLGEPFDPCFHEAVSEMEDPNAEAGIVLTELQKGYTLNRRLIRPAMVVVNRQKTTR